MSGLAGEDPTSAVAEAVVKEIEAAGGEAVAVAEDVSTMAGGERIVNTAVERWGRIDGVVAVAGILRERMLFNMSEDEWDAVIATHLKGHFTVFRHAAAIMRKQESGSLIGFTSGAFAGSVAQANYSAAKGGIVSLVRSAAVGLHRYGVRANAIAPIARTRMSANVPSGLAENGDPEDVAPMVVYLLSDAAKDVTGQVYTVVGSTDRRVEPTGRGAGDDDRGSLDAAGHRRRGSGRSGWRRWPDRAARGHGQGGRRRRQAERLSGRRADAGGRGRALQLRRVDGRPGRSTCPLARAAEDGRLRLVHRSRLHRLSEHSDATYPFNPDGTREFLDDKPFLEPFSLIPALGAVTSTIRFVTFVIKLPIRHPGAGGQAGGLGGRAHRQPASARGGHQPLARGLRARSTCPGRVGASGWTSPSPSSGG